MTGALLAGIGAHLGFGTGVSVDELLAAHARGEIQPWAVGLARPAKIGAVARSVAGDLELLFGLRFAGGDGRPLPYAGSWGRLAIEGSSVRRALDRLVAVEAIVRVTPSRPAWPARRRTLGDGREVRAAWAATYLPGPRTTVGRPEGTGA